MLIDHVQSEPELNRKYLATSPHNHHHHHPASAPWQPLVPPPQIAQPEAAAPSQPCLSPKRRTQNPGKGRATFATMATTTTTPPAPTPMPTSTPTMLAPLTVTTMVKQAREGQRREKMQRIIIKSTSWTISSAHTCTNLLMLQDFSPVAAGGLGASARQTNKVHPFAPFLTK